jgi:hypothetical protein
VAPKLLKVAIENQRWDLAAHVLVLAMVQTKVNGGQKKRSSPRKSKRS